MPYVTAKKPETIGQILKRSLSLSRLAFKRTFPAALILSCVYFIPRLLSLVTNETWFTNQSVFSLENLWLIVIEIISLILFTILLWRVECVMDKKHDTVKQDLTIAFHKLPSIIGAALVQSAILIMMFFMMVGVFYFLREQVLIDPHDHTKLFLLFIPSIAQLLANIYIIFLLLFYLPLILAENKHIFAALSKSAMLVWGNWWRTFGIIMLTWLIYLFSLIVIKYVFQLNIHIYFVRIEQLSYFATFVHIILFALFLQWLAAVFLVQLRDLELRQQRQDKQKK
jgi:hypothetical protein